jgi:hypothetical protein
MVFRAENTKWTTFIECVPTPSAALGKNCSAWRRSLSKFGCSISNTDMGVYTGQYKVDL